MNNDYEALKLSNQLCFPLYAVSKEIVRRYKPFLDEIDLTYTQYITMLLLWEYGSMTVSGIGQKLYLDSGTLSPVLKKLEEKGFVKRTRSAHDEREKEIVLTDEGMALRKRAVKIPSQIGACVNLTAEEAQILYKLLYGILEKMS